MTLLQFINTQVDRKSRLMILITRLFVTICVSNMQELFNFVSNTSQIFKPVSKLPRSMILATGSRRILQERCGKITVSYRKAPKIAGTWKQYSGRKIFGFFPVDSYQLLVLSGRNRPEIIEKNPKNFTPEYCFHKITGITRNRPFPGRTVRPG